MRRVVGKVSIYSGILALSVSLAATQPPAAQEPGPGRDGAQPGPKNLKVLPKNWTGQQVRALMQTFAESLGVQCSHCHTADPTAPPPAEGRAPTLDYSLDDKKEKILARKMIQMTMALNGERLKDVGDAAVPEKVSCFTCHAGAKTPAIKPEKGWGRGNFSLLPAGPTLPARRGGPPDPSATNGGRGRS
jgi:mono/diheme cytochrome c family protein